MRKSWERGAENGWRNQNPPPGIDVAYNFYHNAPRDSKGRFQKNAVKLSIEYLDPLTSFCT